jgi:plastocyanin
VVVIGTKGLVVPRTGRPVDLVALDAQTATEDPAGTLAPNVTSAQVVSGVASFTGVTFTVPGTYQYDCAVHGRDMTGTLVVR